MTGQPQSNSQGRCQALSGPLRIQIRWDDYFPLENCLPEALNGDYGPLPQMIAELTTFLLGLNLNSLDGITIGLVLSRLDEIGRQLAGYGGIKWHSNG